MKSFFDLLVSLTILVLLLPIFFIIAIAIRMDSKGEILFKQTRIGRNGSHFQIYKFRSMVTGAERKGPYYTSENDSRITRVGKFLRKTSLDELPQLINVLKGEMSLVGPRPDVPSQKDIYSEAEWMKRHQVKPGITGLAQATLRSEATTEQRKQMDLEYVDSGNLLLDFKIILLTVKQVLKKGSY